MKRPQRNHQKPLKQDQKPPESIKNHSNLRLWPLFIDQTLPLRSLQEAPLSLCSWRMEQRERRPLREQVRDTVEARAENPWLRFAAVFFVNGNGNPKQLSHQFVCFGMFFVLRAFLRCFFEEHVFALMFLLEVFYEAFSKGFLFFLDTEGAFMVGISH